MSEFVQAFSYPAVVTDIVAIVNEDNSLVLVANEENISDDHFSNERLRFLHCLETINSVLCHSAEQLINSKSLPSIIVFLAGLMKNPFSQRDTYSTESDRSLCNEIRTNLLAASGKNSIENFLHSSLPKSNLSLFESSLSLIEDRLKMSHHKKVPFFRDAGVWLLKQTTYPNLSKYMQTFLPLSLTITDDYRTDLKLLGISCLKHMVNNCLKTEMRHYGHSDVIYDSLSKLLYAQDLEVLDCIYPCLFDFLQTFENAPSNSTNVEACPSGRYDAIAVKLLTDLSIESRLNYKAILGRHLETIVQLLGTSIAKHSQLYMRAFKSVLLGPDYSDQSVKLQLLSSTVIFMKSIWPILADCYEQLFNYIFAFLQECRVLTQDVKDKLQEVFLVLSAYDITAFNFIFSSLKSETLHEKFLDDIMEKCQSKIYI